MAPIRQVTFDFHPPTPEECLKMKKKELIQWANAVRNVHTFLGYVADVPEVQRRRNEFERLSKNVSDTYDHLRKVLTRRLTESEFMEIEQAISKSRVHSRNW